MIILQKILAPLSTFADKAFPHSSLSPTNLIVEKLRREASGTNWPGGRCRRRRELAVALGFVEVEGGF